MSQNIRKRIARATKRFRPSAAHKASPPPTVQSRNPQDARVEELYTAWNLYLPAFIEAVARYEDLKKQMNEIQKQLNINVEKD